MYALIDSNSFFPHTFVLGEVAPIPVADAPLDRASQTKPMYAAGIVVRVIGDATEAPKSVAYDSPTVQAVRRRRQTGLHRGFAVGPDNDMIWEISADEKNAIVAEVAELTAKAQAKARAAELEVWLGIIRRAEKQADIPSREEARRRQTLYNNVYNEGGEGYVPPIVSADQYAYAKRMVAELAE